MITTEKLYNLIATLQSAEKRFFRLMVERQEEGSRQQYMELFNLMENSIARDVLGETTFTLPEAVLITRMKRKGVAENRFHVIRNNLTQVLFKALRLMQEDNNKEDSIRILLKEAKLLERRGFFEWAEEKSEEALELATTYEYHVLAVEAIRNLVYLRGQRDTSGYADKIRGYVQDMEGIAAQYYREQQFFSLHYQSFVLYRTRKGLLSADLHREIEHLQQQLAALHSEGGRSFLSNIYFNQASASLADLKGGNAEGIKFHVRNLDIWESEAYRHMQQERPRQFIIQLFNYLSFCVTLGDFKSYERHFKTFEHFKPANFDDEAEAFQNRVFLQQLYCLNSGRLEEAKNLIPAIEKGLKKYAFKINKSRLFAIRYHIILTYFMSGEYANALHHCNTLQQYGKSDQRRDVQLFTNILRHIAHLELEEFEALEKFVKSVKNNLSTVAGHPDFERIVLTYLIQLAEICFKDQIASRRRTDALKQVYHQFERDLQAYKTAKPPQIPLGYEETLLWVQGKLK